MRVRLHNKPKPNNYTESFAVNMADIRGKERVSTRGGLVDVIKAIENLRLRLKQDLSREVSRSHSTNTVANVAGRAEL